jgi:hypothetical protein
MSVVITEILGTDAFSGSRLTINANFASIANEVNNIESIFGISLTNGNMNLTANAGGGIIQANQLLSGIVQLPATGVATITLTGSTGAIVGTTLTLSTSANIPNLTVNNFTATALGSSSFSGQATFNNLLLLRGNGGLALGQTVSLGAISSYVVGGSADYSSVLLFQPTGTSPDVLTLTADPSLPDGHILVVVPTTGHFCEVVAGAGFSILGVFTISFARAYSSVTLMYSAANLGWIIIANNGATIS